MAEKVLSPSLETDRKGVPQEIALDFLKGKVEGVVDQVHGVSPLSRAERNDPLQVTWIMVEVSLPDMRRRLWVAKGSAQRGEIILGRIAHPDCGATEKLTGFARQE